MKVDSQGKISPSQAHYVLGKLLSERRVSAREIATYLSQMDSEIKDLEARLALLRETRGAAAAPAAAAPAAIAPRRRRGRPAGRRKAAAKAVKAAVVADAKPAVRPAKATRRRSRRSSKRTSAQVAGSQQLQGKYLSLIRQIAKDRRSVYQQVALQQGREEAIRQMSTELKK